MTEKELQGLKEQEIQEYTEWALETDKETPVILLMALGNRFNLSSYESQCFLAEYYEDKRNREICERIGHIITKAESLVMSESGIEQIQCGRCGMVNTIYWS